MLNKKNVEYVITQDRLKAGPRYTYVKGKALAEVRLKREEIGGYHGA
jgi:hypothetical protein